MVAANIKLVQYGSSGAFCQLGCSCCIQRALGVLLSVPFFPVCFSDLSQMLLRICTIKRYKSKLSHILQLDFIAWTFFDGINTRIHQWLCTFAECVHRSNNRNFHARLPKCSMGTFLGNAQYFVATFAKPKTLRSLVIDRNLVCCKSSFAFSMLLISPFAKGHSCNWIWMHIRIALCLSISQQLACKNYTLVKMLQSHWKYIWSRWQPTAQFFRLISNCIFGWLFIGLAERQQTNRTRVARPTSLNKCNKWDFVHGNRFAIPT